MIEKLDPEKGIIPDCWVLLEINHNGEKFQKILSGWGGSYLYGDSWRMSSPIKEINEDEDYLVVETESGSSYVLWKSYQGLRMSIAGTYSELKEKFGDKVDIVHYD